MYRQSRDIIPSTFSLSPTRGLSSILSRCDAGVFRNKKKKKKTENERGEVSHDRGTSAMQEAHEKTRDYYFPLFPTDSRSPPRFTKTDLFYFKHHQVSPEYLQLSRITLPLPLLLLLRNGCSPFTVGEQSRRLPLIIIVSHRCFQQNDTFACKHKRDFASPRMPLNRRRGTRLHPLLSTD